MCLIVDKNNKELQTAEEGLVVYKLILEENGFLITYFKEADIKLGETYTSDLKKEFNIDYDIDIVNIGLHSFVNLNEVYEYMIYNKRLLDHVFLIKCIIPKGSTYYKGSFINKIGLYASDTIKSIASDTLRYTDEIINEWIPNRF